MHRTQRTARLEHAVRQGACHRTVCTKRETRRNDRSATALHCEAFARMRRSSSRRRSHAMQLRSIPQALAIACSSWLLPRCVPLRSSSAPLRHARESAASPRVPAVSHSGAQHGAAALRRRSIGVGGPSAVMRFALRDFAAADSRPRAAVPQVVLRDAGGQELGAPHLSPAHPRRTCITRSQDTRTRTLAPSHARTGARMQRTAPVSLALRHSPTVRGLTNAALTRH